MDKKLFFIFLLWICAAPAFSQSADSTLKRSPVRTISDQQYNAWIKGIDINNKGYVAELNHYPLPDKISRYKKELDLSPNQITRINEINKVLRMKKLEIGESVIRNEKMLDSFFRTRKLDEGMIIFYGNRYGLYEGEYRTAVLEACYNTERLLSAWQIKKFEALQKHN